MSFQVRVLCIVEGSSLAEHCKTKSEGLGIATCKFILKLSWAPDDTPAELTKRELGSANLKSEAA